VENKKVWNYALIEKAVVEKPDLICYSWILTQYNPHLEVFSIFQKMGIPVVCWWWDFMFVGSQQIAQELTPFITAHLTVDTPVVLIGNLTFIRDVHRHKYHGIWPLLPKNTFFKDKSKRTIPVSFPGASIEGGNKGPRAEYVELIKSSGIDLFLGKNRFEEPLIEYANNLRKTKLVLNVTQGVQLGDKTVFIIKGRTFEAISCGAALLEPAGSLLEYYFTPDIDYISYKDEKDMIDKIEYYSDHEGERAKIAMSGFKKVSQEYNINRYWERVIEIAGINK
jgi:hypothetical protein